MAVTSFHVRSNSLPSRPHPLVAEVEENISKLRSSQSASSSLSASHNLKGLQDLQDCVEKLLALPLNQQALVQDQKFLNQILDGSLRLLDFCNTAKDALSLMKESVFELQSVLRRRVQGGGLHLNDVKQYIASRKVVKKAIQKALKNLKGVESSSNESPEIVAVLRDVEAITRDVFESLASFISQPRRPNGWSMVSKLMHHKKVACEQEEEEKRTNEFALVDASLETTFGNKTSKYEKVQSDLKDLVMCIEDLEEGTECLYRRMLKTRVSLLNIFN